MTLQTCEVSQRQCDTPVPRKVEVHGGPKGDFQGMKDGLASLSLGVSLFLFLFFNHVRFYHISHKVCFVFHDIWGWWCPVTNDWYCSMGLKLSTSLHLMCDLGRSPPESVSWMSSMQNVTEYVMIHIDPYLLYTHTYTCRYTYTYTTQLWSTSRNSMQHLGILFHHFRFL